MFTIIRNRETVRSDFVFTCDRLTRLVVEFALSLLPYESKTVITPTGDEFVGLSWASSICGVAVIRSGESMEDALRSVCGPVRIGKILIQKNTEENSRDLIYARLPEDVSSRKVLLMDPVASSGRTIIRAMKVLLKSGVPEENVILVTLVASRRAVCSILAAFPGLTICVGEVDEAVKGDYVVPGLGTFGDRYYGTDI
ncbi:uracil phosphoribosyltransferase [Thecamonas trahens ATCC 50062]|uniref:uracil phosphoribosyltransferase n=1 Tax=Thecamonas trahens ATCC 50062 TaxID=461836 RepID=A0A0L0DJE7_THETB|nr:uracil phosphoribosyltransferase [Thecamonas trahens ATCC 50062]KNC51448.1 uracil phosphoribosyltransferase [Thecamonas trahens ATCC 50062]|eukprot:XP_013756110.1 uracil phosphoribosyltransferase [Thecamonas trahens ATCC 50062]